MHFRFSLKLQILIYIVFKNSISGIIIYIPLRAFGATSYRDSPLRASMDSAMRASDSISNSLRSALRESQLLSSS